MTIRPSWTQLDEIRPLQLEMAASSQRRPPGGRTGYSDHPACAGHCCITANKDDKCPNAVSIGPATAISCCDQLANRGGEMLCTINDDVSIIKASVTFRNSYCPVVPKDWYSS
uniref:Uncharacterized protein n=1 Tax=Romanomermis culicivorax TaxID=13658 RepID=A0A915JEW4_ROMCU